MRAARPRWPRARAAGHEILVHVPMQPANGQEPDPGELQLAMPERELRERLAANLSRFEGYIGASNHMGSSFSADAAAMTPVVAEIGARGLIWFDSRTSPDSVGEHLAERLSVPTAARDVFLDTEDDVTVIEAELVRLERIALKKGSAIAIGHPRDPTLAALARWQVDARARGFRLVPLSAVISWRSRASG
jgi:polysaccharide deacetylase 2 family uncharacterized protein YibQ